MYENFRNILIFQHLNNRVIFIPSNIFRSVLIALVFFLIKTRKTREISLLLICVPRRENLDKNKIIFLN